MSVSETKNGRIVITKLLFVQQLYNPPPTCGGSPLPRNVGLIMSAIADILGCTVPPLSYSLPRDLSTTLEMTKLSTVSQGWRADEGVRPYLIGHLLSFRPKRNNLK